MTDLERDLAAVLNKHSEEFKSDTPDFVLARFLLVVLQAFHTGLNARKAFFAETEEAWREVVAQQAAEEIGLHVFDRDDADFKAIILKHIKIIKPESSAEKIH
jgi:hypothetical protein